MVEPLIAPGDGGVDDANFSKSIGIMMAIVFMLFFGMLILQRWIEEDQVDRLEMAMNWFTTLMKAALIV